MMKKICLVHADIYTPKGVVCDGTVVLENGKITAIDPSFVSLADATTVDATGLSIIPGYIDAHCHGGGGFDCNDATAASVLGMRDFYSSHGVTTLYPTLAANSWQQTMLGLEAIRAAMHTQTPGRACLRGCHLEGPFLNKAHKGCQAEDALIGYKKEVHAAAIESFRDVIRRVTIAPEVEKNLEAFELFKQMGVQISIGHSNAEYKQMVQAVQMGATSVTHLYNAMSQTKKVGPFRVGGVLEAGLTLDGLFAEIIADGYHLPAELIRIAYRCKGAGGLSICSDANSAAGSLPGATIRTCGLTVYIEQGVAMNSERTSLASSISPIDQMVRYLIFEACLPASDVVQMASQTTARMMGIDEQTGSIVVGKDADINLVNNDFQVVQTFCKGVLVK